MLEPKARICTVELDNGEKQCAVKYNVWDTEACGYVVNRVFSTYDTAADCQRDIDFYSQFKIVRPA